MSPNQPATSVPILGISISTLGFDSALAQFQKQVVKEGPGQVICFTNAYSLTEGLRNQVLHGALSRSHCVADGMPLVWISRWKKNPIGSRVCGPDFMHLFMKNNQDLPQGFIGGPPGQAERLVARYELRGAICHSPPMRAFSKEAVQEDWQTFLKKCGGKAPRVVWVGLGSPKQEMWMDVARDLAPDVFFLGVGAAYDFLTGQKARAPVWMQTLGLEWFFRLVTEPRRLWKRYLVFNTLFVFANFKELLGFSPKRV